MNENLTPHASFSVNLSFDGLQYHPFVRKRVMPALLKSHAKQINVLKEKYKKRLANANLPANELADKIWGGVLYDLIQHYIKLEADDRSLSFALFDGGAHRYYVWDNHYKNFYPTDDFSFEVPLTKDTMAAHFNEDGIVYLRGKLGITNKGGEKYMALRVYFYVEDKSERRSVDETKMSENVGMLCEVPFFFLRNDRYETFGDEMLMSSLLNIFELKREADLDPLDFTPTDELGDMKIYPSPTTIGNDYVTVWIK